MTLVLLCVGVGFLCMPGWLSPFAGRIHPHERVRVWVVAVALGAALVELSVVLFAAPAVLGSLGFASLAHSSRLLVHLSSRGLQFGWGAALVAGLMPVLVYRGWQRARAATAEMRVEPAFGVHRRLDDIEFVELPTPALVAYSIDGPDPQVVVSDGLVTLLAADELDMVVGHEIAHVRARHGRTLCFLSAIETPVPLLRRVNQSLRVSIERWADESAIRRDPKRRAVLLDALVKVNDADAPRALAAFTHRSGVVERAQALLAEPLAPTRIQRIGARAALGGAAAGGVVIAAGWGFGAHVMLSIAGIFCA